ncbi:GTP-binding protein [Faecalibacterium prausnitzii]|jgi:G3E family GTPase|uniref:GTP-binding protein n=1 Tax=Faecalibacterium prausnitzii TaxID=853 RepID=UPI000E4872C0|nr:GTP-binding protein [Faecalibacterium prausnitzii]RGW77509.1 cobalamin biosynthesis protein CobW [Faecalibacterium prausnitzii]
MTKIDIFSGFLGAGKTTLIKKLITEAFAGQQVVLIENEFGEIGIDGGFLKESGIQINELNAGCICCSLVGDFRTALQQVVEQYHPDRIVIEPSGVGKLSDVTRAVEGVAEHLDVQLNSFVTVADVNKVKMYMKNFGEFYDDQISHASCILLSRTQTASEEKIAAAVAMLREKNPTATIVTTAWDHLTGEQILKAMSTKDDFKAELIAMAAKANEEHAHEDEEEEHEHHHHHDHENGVCSCGHHHDHDDDDDDEDEHEHHHHDHDEHDHDDHCCCGHHHDHDDDDDEHEHEHEHHHHDHDEHDHDHEEHEHHHDHDGHCCCGHHHHDHHADEVFTSWGVETARKFTKAEVEHALTELDTGNYGMILRSKGIVDGGADGWLEFDYVPGEWEVRSRSADVGGKLVVIGSKLNETAIAQLFGC